MRVQRQGVQRMHVMALPCKSKAKQSTLTTTALLAAHLRAPASPGGPTTTQSLHAEGHRLHPAWALRCGVTRTVQPLCQQCSAGVCFQCKLNPVRCLQNCPGQLTGHEDADDDLKGNSGVGGGGG